MHWLMCIFYSSPQRTRWTSWGIWVVISWYAKAEIRQTTPCGTLKETVTRSWLPRGRRSASRYKPRLSTSTMPLSRISYSVRGWIPSWIASLVLRIPPFFLKMLFAFLYFCWTFFIFRYWIKMYPSIYYWLLFYPKKFRQGKSEKGCFSLHWKLLAGRRGQDLGSKTTCDNKIKTWRLTLEMSNLMEARSAGIKFTWLSLLGSIYKFYSYLENIEKIRRPLLINASSSAVATIHGVPLACL